MSDQIENAKRPKPGDDESEIIQQMKDFESSKSSISRENIVSFQKDKKPLSKFAQQRQAAATAGPSKTDQKYQQENVLKAVIQEKEFDYEQYTAQIMKIQKPSETRVVAFPNVMKLDKIVNSEKGKSLFSSQAIQCSGGASSNIQLKSKVIELNKVLSKKILSFAKIIHHKIKYFIFLLCRWFLVVFKETGVDLLVVHV